MKCEYGMTCMYEPHASHFTPSSGQATEGESESSGGLSIWIMYEPHGSLLQSGQATMEQQPVAA